MSLNATDSATPKQKDWLSVRQAADLIGVNAATIRTLIDKGRLPAYRFSERVIRVRRRDLENAGRRVESLAV